MDPLAHTLVGASLAQTDLKRLSRWPTATLILAANAPDIDAVTLLATRDLSLGFRRGWTHGVLAMVALPLALAGMVWLVDRVLARRGRHPPQARFSHLSALAAVGVLSHPLLDWLNTYGVRLLMPFDGRWFYGDALFIVDPWVWLLAGTAVVLSSSRSGVGIGLWLIVGVVLTALIVGFPGVPPTARILWLVGLASLAGLRALGWGQRQLSRVATTALACGVIYILLMVAGTVVARHQVRAWLDREAEPVEVMAGPLPANPFARDIVVVDDAHYHFLEVNWLRGDPIRFRGQSIDRGPRGPIVQAALTAPQVQGLRTWMRFPAFTVEPLGDGYRVSIRDIRYARFGDAGLGAATVELDDDLRVRPLTGARAAQRPFGEQLARSATEADHPSMVLPVAPWDATGSRAARGSTTAARSSERLAVGSGPVQPSESVPHSQPGER